MLPAQGSAQSADAPSHTSHASPLDFVRLYDLIRANTSESDMNSLDLNQSFEIGQAYG